MHTGAYTDTHTQAGQYKEGAEMEQRWSSAEGCWADGQGGEMLPPSLALLQPNFFANTQA